MMEKRENRTGRKKKILAKSGGNPQNMLMCGHNFGYDDKCGNSCNMGNHAFALSDCEDVQGARSER